MRGPLDRRDWKAKALRKRGSGAKTRYASTALFRPALDQENHPEADAEARLARVRFVTIHSPLDHYGLKCGDGFAVRFFRTEWPAT